jgi:hypothetical protein
MASNMNRPIRMLMALSAAGLLPGCVDQDAFGLSCRPIAGNYCLRQWEDEETYYIDTLDGKDHGGGSVIDGTVKAISWNAQYIVVLRDPNFEPDGYGYMSINVQNGKLNGPVASVGALRIKGAPMPTVVSPKVAWHKLGR